MTATETNDAGSAARNARLWGARPADWAENEAQAVPAYEAALACVELRPGDAVLDVGCGAGTFLGLVADRGAQLHGIDAAEPLFVLARERVPGADLRAGDMQWLPWEDDRFDLVTGFCSFFFAADPTAALAEAGRVAKPGAPVIAQVWGRPDRCDLAHALRAVAPLRPARTGGPDLWRPGVLEGMASDAGLRPLEAFDLRYAFEYADRDELVRCLLGSGGMAEAVDAGGEERVASLIAEALAPFRGPDGGYRVENDWRFLVATA